MSEPSEEDQHQGNQEHSPATVSPVKSVLAALFGVQKDVNREKDFKSGDVTQFIGVGIVITITMVVAMIVFVNWVLAA